MALWMDAGATPTTEKEKADLEAISALKESTAIEFKVPLSSLARSILMFDVVSISFLCCLNTGRGQ
jgi:hypothetical protein